MIKLWLSETVFQKLSKEGIAVSCPVDLPPDTAFGDLAMPLGFALAKVLKQSPVQALSQVLPFLNCNEGIGFSVQTGFLNVRFSDEFLWENLHRFATVSPSLSGTVLLEYVSANPTGPLHIGHGRWAVIGSVLASILRGVGYTVHTEFYINDAGNQIEKLRQSVDALRQGNPVPEEGYHGAYVQDLAKSDLDPVLQNLSQQKSDLSAIGVVFDTWFSEKSLHASGAIDAAIATLEAAGVTYQLDGALWFRSTDFGDDKDRVLRKADGALTYFAVDVAYHVHKLARNCDQIINIWGADHHGYVPRVRAAIHALYGERRAITPAFRVLLGQMVALFRDGEPVRMSKRTGDMVTLAEVVEEVGADAVRYYLASKSADTHIDFDLVRAREKSAENPVYYIQYAHARLCGILRKSGQATPKKNVLQGSLHPRERALMLHMAQYGDVLHEAAAHFAPHKWVQYAYDLARASHHMYEACPILGDPLEAQRLYLAAKTRDVLANALQVLGISAPESM